MPLSYACVNLKPGAGKTTSAVWSAYALHASGLSPLPVDSDLASLAPCWSELAGGFPSPALALPVAGVHRRVSCFLENRRAMMLDAPQLEDHAHIARGVIRQASEWILPVTPAPSEPDRMAPVDRETDDMQSLALTDRAGQPLSALARAGETVLRPLGQDR